MSERRCPKCGAVYPETARFCPRDGNMLVEAQSKAPSPSAAAASPSGGTGVRTPPPPPPPPRPRPPPRPPPSGPVLGTRRLVPQERGARGMVVLFIAARVL